MAVVKLYGVSNATADQEKIIRAGCDVIDEVLKDSAWDKFAEQVRAADFSGGQLWRSKDGSVETKSKDAILEIIQHGRERENPSADNEIDIRIELRPHPKGTVGTTALGKNPIKPAYWFVDRCLKQQDAISMARHLMHEWMHVAGFFHSSSGPSQDDVAYEIGDVVRKVAKGLRTESLEKGDVPKFEDEDSLIAHLLDEAEDEVEWDTNTVTTTSAVAEHLPD